MSATAGKQAVSLLDEALGLARGSGSVCRVAKLRETHPDLAVQLDAAYGKVSATALARALKNHDVTISDQTLNRHFRHECSCEPR